MCSHCIVFTQNSVQVKMKLFFFYMNKYGKRLVYNFMRCNVVKLIAFHLAIISNSENFHF